MLAYRAMRHLERIRGSTDRAGFVDGREGTKGIQRQPGDVVALYHNRKTNSSTAFLASLKHRELLDFMDHTNGGGIAMASNFSNYRAENVSTRRSPASGIDRETVHRIRHQGRIERAKIVRQCFAMLKRAITKRVGTAVRFGHGSS